MLGLQSFGTAVLVTTICTRMESAVLCTQIICNHAARHPYPRPEYEATTWIRWVSLHVSLHPAKACMHACHHVVGRGPFGGIKPNQTRPSRQKAASCAAAAQPDFQPTSRRAVPNKQYSPPRDEIAAPRSTDLNLKGPRTRTKPDGAPKPPDAEGAQRHEAGDQTFGRS